MCAFQSRPWNVVLQSMQVNGPRHHDACYQLIELIIKESTLSSFGFFIVS